MSQQSALIANWENHMQDYIRTVVAREPRELLSPLLGPQFKAGIKKLEKEQRRATKMMKQSMHPRNRNWGAWDCLVWLRGGWTAAANN